MAGSRKHGAHRYVLSIPAAAAAAAGDVVAATLTYDAFAGGSGVATANSPRANYDLAAEQLVEAVLTMYVALVGAATNFVTVQLTHRNSAGTIQNQIQVLFNAAGVVTVAFVPINLAVAGGAVATGAGTGTLTVATGVALPWNIVPGDTVTLDRASTGTGIATPAMSATLLRAAKGA